MKKGILIMLAIAAVLGSMFVSGCSTDQVTSILNIDVSHGKELVSYDSHGGFHGDGLTFRSLSFTDDQVINEIVRSKKWKPLPLTDPIKRLTSEDYIYDESGNRFFPEIQHGYYMFIDRHRESSDPSDDSKVLNRSSFNFTIAVYDTDQDILYYAEFDT